MLLTAVTFPAHAANAVVGNGSPGSCNESALNQAVNTVNNTGGGTITFNCGSANHTIFITSQKVFSSSGASYIVDGGGKITIDAQKLDRIFHVKNNITFTIRNITLKRGNAKNDSGGSRSANQGGAIYSGLSNKLTIVNVNFNNNTAIGNSEAWHGGGALRIDDGTTAVIHNSKFYRNRSNASGGAINNLISNLTITNSEFIENESRDWRGGGGGAIYNDMGKMTISTSTFKGNTSVKLGGAIYTWAAHKNEFSGRVKISNTLIDSNRVTDETANGGGIYHGSKNKLIIENSTLSHNIAGRNGAGLFATDNTTVEISNSTFSGNRLPVKGVGAGITFGDSTATLINTTIAFNYIGSDNGSDGAGIFNWGSNVTLISTIIANNTGGWKNCGGNYNNGGGNLQYPGNSCGGGISVGNPNLAPLANNGGDTPTHALQGGSKAISKGVNCKPTDQRGVSRPQGNACDSGAYELVGNPPGPMLLLQPSSTVTTPHPTIVWTSSIGANTYRIKIKKPNGKKYIKVKGDSNTFNCSSQCSYTVQRPLKDGKRYKLIIVAKNNIGKTRVKQKFTTNF